MAETCWVVLLSDRSSANIKNASTKWGSPRAWADTWHEQAETLNNCRESRWTAVLDYSYER